MQRISEKIFSMYVYYRFGINDILCGIKAYSVSYFKNQNKFDSGKSVGTTLALLGLRNGATFKTVAVNVSGRKSGLSRFGLGWRAEKRIFIALLEAIKQDVMYFLYKRSA